MTSRCAPIQGCNGRSSRGGRAKACHSTKVVLGPNEVSGVGGSASALAMPRGKAVAMAASVVRKWTLLVGVVLIRSILRPPLDPR